MDAIDRALEESLKRQREGVSVASGEPHRFVSKEHRNAVDPFSPEAILRAANEDDDLYDPYSDYMDMLSSEEFDELESEG